jgi:hypothetical protein
VEGFAVTAVGVNGFAVVILGDQKLFIEDQWRMIVATDFFTLRFSNDTPPWFAV